MKMAIIKNKPHIIKPKTLKKDAHLPLSRKKDKASGDNTIPSGCGIWAGIGCGAGAGIGCGVGSGIGGNSGSFVSIVLRFKFSLKISLLKLKTKFLLPNKFVLVMHNRSKNKHCDIKVNYQAGNINQSSHKRR